MLSRVRTRLSYANVMATLALFLALGGSSYAISQVTSRDVKNRSLKGADLRRNTVTGKEVRESRLARVPKATEALRAGSATTAATAAAADVATNAQTLAGQNVASFEKASRTQYGRAPLAPPNSGEERTVLSWDAMNAEIRTSSAGCAGDKLRLRLRKSTGQYVTIYERGDEKATVVGGQDLNLCSDEDGRWEGALADAAGRTLFFECFSFANSELRCIGTRSEP